MLLLKHFCGEEMHKTFVAAEKGGSIRYGDLKKEVADAISGEFTDFRARRSELLENHDEIGEILITGAAKAQKIASANMDKVRKLVGIR